MENPKISVVVPVYKVEKYLDRCVQSILNQTFPDFELILVDDGSPDNCGAMCNAYAKQDSRVQVIHKENGGLSDARNVGKTAATGEYILFVDSDDFIKENTLEKLYQLACQNDADIVLSRICNCYGKRQDPEADEIKTYICSGTEALRAALIGTETISICGKLIKGNIAKKHNFPVGRTCEDAFFTPRLLLDVHTTVVTNQTLYYYWHRAGSISTTCDPKRVMDIVDAYLLTKKLVEEKRPELIPYVQFRIYWAYLCVLDTLLLFPGYQKLPQYKECKQYLKKNWFSIISCSFFKPSRRIAVFFLKINIYLYRLLLLLDRAKKGIYN